MFRIVNMAIVMMLLCSLFPPTVAAEYNSSLMTLSSRLLGTCYPGATEVEVVNIQEGVLPENMSAEVPLPPEASVLGSLERVDSVEIVLDVNMTPDQILDFYKNNLSAINWTDTEVSDRGFVPYLNSLNLQEMNGSLTLTITAYPYGNGSDVRIILGREILCSGCQYPTDDWLRPLPRLMAPPGSVESNEEYGSGMNSVSCSAVLETDLNLADLETHYASQLAAASWMPLAAGADGPLAWSTWKLTDEENATWMGLFFALGDSENEGSCSVFFKAEMTV